MLSHRICNSIMLKYYKSKYKNMKLNISIKYAYIKSYNEYKIT